MATCSVCGREFPPDPELSAFRFLLKMTSLRNPFLRFSVVWILGGILGMVVFLLQDSDTQARVPVLLILAVVIVLSVAVTVNIVIRYRRESRICPRCRDEIDRGSSMRSEELGPHKVTINKATPGDDRPFTLKRQ